MVWPVASTGHLSKRGSFDALLDVASSAVFKIFQYPLDSGKGCFGLLLLRFGGAFEFKARNTLVSNQRLQCRRININ